VEFELHKELRDAGLLPITAERLDEADSRLRRVVDTVAARYEERLAPAIDRVFRDAVDSLTADAREMLRREAQDPRWRPTHFELSFGLDNREARDEASVSTPMAVEAGLLLRGSIDLVEESAEGTIRATDYKTGKVRAKEGETVIGGGLTLQPVLYAMALERFFPGKLVEGGRLYYCTAAAGFQAVWVPLDEEARAGASAVVNTVARALEEGFLPAAPAKNECTYCDYKVVCGPYEEMRVGKIKFQDKLKPLVELRRRR
jgi:CRISPR/Cas system-associated exonuclease Cas4 (RecB family)